MMRGNFNAPIAGRKKNTYPVENPVQPYNGEEFKDEFLKYMAEKKNEYDAYSKFNPARYFTYYKYKESYQTELFRLIDAYEQVKKHKGNVKEVNHQLVKKLNFGIEYFTGEAFKYTELCKLLHKWCARVIRDCPKSNALVEQMDEDVEHNRRIEHKY